MTKATRDASSKKERMGKKPSNHSRSSKKADRGRKQKFPASSPHISTRESSPERKSSDQRVTVNCKKTVRESEEESKEHEDPERSERIVLPTESMEQILADLDGDMPEAPKTTSNNPLWVQYGAGELHGLTPRKIAELGIVPIIICLRPNQVPDTSLLKSANLSAAEIERGAKIYRLLRMPSSMMEQTYATLQGRYIEREHISPWNNDSIDLQESEYVVSMPQVPSEVVEHIRMLYPAQLPAGSIGLISDALTILGERKDSAAFQQLRVMNFSRDTADYWTHQYNCYMTINGWFRNRCFEYDKRRSLGLSVKDGADDKDGKKDKKKKTGEEKDGDETDDEDKKEDADASQEVTLPEIATNVSFTDALARRTVYVDGEHATRFRGANMYEPFPNIPITDKFLEEWSHAGSKLAQYDVLCRYLVNPVTAHVVTDSKVLTTIRDIVEEYMPAIRYVWGYSWLALYLEECKLRYELSSESRCSISLRDACELPTCFPSVAGEQTLSPYVPLLLSKEFRSNRSGKSSTYGISIPTDWHAKGVCNPEELNRNLSLFTTSKPDCNLLHGIEWNTKTGVRARLSGSVMQACMQKVHVGAGKFKTAGNSWNDALNMYMLKYYTRGTMRADMDMGAYSPTIFVFLDWCARTSETYVGNALRYRIIKTRRQAKTNIVKSLYFYISRKYLERTFPERNINLMMKNLSRDKHLRQHFYAIYVTMKSANNNVERNRHNSTELYEAHWSFTKEEDMNLLTLAGDEYHELPDSTYGDLEYYIRANDTVLPTNVVAPVHSEANPVLVRFAENIKVQIVSAAMNHDLEMYRIRMKHHEQHVARFHYPVVRGFIWYREDGQIDATLMPSKITECMTNHCLDYKCFAGTKDPRDIAIKVFLRGGGCDYTIEECTQLQPAWRRSMRVRQVSGRRFADDRRKGTLFKRRKVFNDIDLNGGVNDPYKYTMGCKDYSVYVQTEWGLTGGSGIHPAYLRTISEDGFVEPLNIGMLIESFRLLNNSKNLHTKPFTRYSAYGQPLLTAGSSADGDDGSDDEEQGDSSYEDDSCDNKDANKKDAPPTDDESGISNSDNDSSSDKKKRSKKDKHKSAKADKHAKKSASKSTVSDAVGKWNSASSGKPGKDKKDRKSKQKYVLCVSEDEKEVVPVSNKKSARKSHSSPAKDSGDDGISPIPTDEEYSDAGEIHDKSCKCRGCGGRTAVETHSDKCACRKCKLHDKSAGKVSTKPDSDDENSYSLGSDDSDHEEMHDPTCNCRPCGGKGKPVHSKYCHCRSCESADEKSGHNSDENGTDKDKGIVHGELSIAGLSIVQVSDYDHSDNEDAAYGEQHTSSCNCRDCGGSALLAIHSNSCACATCTSTPVDQVGAPGPSNVIVTARRSSSLLTTVDASDNNMCNESNDNSCEASDEDVLPDDMPMHHCECECSQCGGKPGNPEIHNQWCVCKTCRTRTSSMAAVPAQEDDPDTFMDRFHALTQAVQQAASNASSIADEEAVELALVAPVQAVVVADPSEPIAVAMAQEECIEEEDNDSSAVVAEPEPSADMRVAVATQHVDTAPVADIVHGVMLHQADEAPQGDDRADMATAMADSAVVDGTSDHVE